MFESKNMLYILTILEAIAGSNSPELESSIINP